MHEVIENKFRPHTEDMRNLTPISAQTLREKFGSTSYIYPKIKAKLEAFWKEVKDEQSIKTEMDNWASVIRTLYGYKPDVSLLVDHTYLNILVVFHHQLKFTSSGYNFNLTFYKS